MNRHVEALEHAHERGRAGASRPGDELLFVDGRDPSDSFIGKLTDAFEAGRQQRGQALRTWLSARVVELTGQFLETGRPIEELGAWLLEQYANSPSPAGAAVVVDSVEPPSAEGHGRAVEFL